MKRFWKIGIALIPLAFLGLAASVVQENNRQFEISKNIEVFANLYKELNALYVDDIEPGKLMRTGLEAMVSSLDPFTNYIAESDIEGYRLATEGKFHGIGAESEAVGEYITITELYKGQAADEAGLRVGDQILSIDGKDVVGKKQDEVDFMLQGFPGTTISLTIQRPGVNKPINISLTRAEVKKENVPYFGLVGDDDVAYISLTTFTRQAGKNVSNALRDLKLENPELKGVILDLRGNGGGLLSEAVNVCNVFIPQGELVVTTKGKVREWDRSFNTRGSATDLDLPVTVLINNRSASASEIVSGVIQDYDRGVLIGQRSYGKGLVQNTKDIGYKSKLKLTTAKYYIPSGRCIQSVEYEDGEPVDIPDNRRTPFKTRNGRTVLDGGGVAPDIKLERPDDNNPVIKSLRKNHLIFNFATEYLAKMDVPEQVEELRFSDFNAFLTYLEDKSDYYDTKSEQILDKLKESAETEGYSIDQQLSALEKQIKAEQKAQIIKNKDLLVDLIEKEMAGRAFYQEGKVRIGLRNDKEIVEAIRILKTPAAYEAVLRAQ